MMTEKAARAYLERWLRAELRGVLAASVGMFLASAGVLFLTFWIVDFFLGAVARKLLLAPSNTAKVWCSFGFVVFLQLLYVLAWRERPEELSFTRTPFGRQINPMAPDSMASCMRLLVGIMFIGPAMLTASVRGMARALRLRRFDLDGSAKLLAKLASSPKKLSLAELARTAGDIDVPRALAGLRELQGVVFLSSEPPGLALTDDLRSKLYEFEAQMRS